MSICRAVEFLLWMVCLARSCARCTVGVRVLSLASRCARRGTKQQGQLWNPAVLRRLYASRRRRKNKTLALERCFLSRSVRRGFECPAQFREKMGAGSCLVGCCVQQKRVAFRTRQKFWCWLAPVLPRRTGA